MPEPEDTLRDSPVDFSSAVAYALHPEMRRLILVYIAGSVLIPVGLSIIVRSPFTAITAVDGIIGVCVVVLGGVLFFGGLVGSLFKLVADANILAGAVER